MNSFHRLQAVLFVLPAVVLLTACSSNTTGQQNPVAQTQQGIQVGLNVYNSDNPTEQPVPATQQMTQNLNVTVMSPNLSEPLPSPVEIHGSVSGVFFSEGVFPVILQDSKGNEIARTLAHADGEWMTEDVVPFTADLTFTAPADKAAKLIFQKDNPSGLPQNDHSQSFDVTLK